MVRTASGSENGSIMSDPPWPGRSIAIDVVRACERLGVAPQIGRRAGQPVQEDDRRASPPLGQFDTPAADGQCPLMHSEDATSAAADDEYRSRSALNWESAAAGWEAERDRMRAISTPVTAWLVDHLELRPGVTVLEIAAGTGDVGITVAEALAGSGRVIVSDRAAAMVESAGRWAAERGAPGVERARARRRVARPARRERRPGRVPVRATCSCPTATRPSARRGGCCAQAAGSPSPSGPAASANDWATTLWDVLERYTDLPPARPGGPGMFALADRGVVEDMLGRAGLEPRAIEQIPVAWRYADFDDYWQAAAALNGGLTRLLPTLSDAERADLAGAVRAAIARFRDGEGYRLPGLALGVAAAVPGRV